MFVAVDDDEVVGWCDTYVRAGEPLSGLVWVAVREGRRRRGIGAELFRAAAEHLGDIDALVSYSSSGAEMRFLADRGFAAGVSVLDPRRVSAAPTGDALPLTDVVDRVPELHRIHTDGLGEVYGSAVAEQELDKWSARTLRDPDLSLAGSRVAIVEGRIASLTFLTVAGNGASNEMTATLPELRRRGLARAAKLATLRWAAANGIEAVYTSTYADNVPILAVNRRLGYERVATSVDFTAPASA